MSPRIVVIVAPDGATRLETVGYVGPACREASRALEAALGLVQADQPTAAYHQTATVAAPLTESTGPAS
jgi:hypothetical protein